ncbi:hypothetical protein LCGC14_1705890 [marine sediment metagenome]|uniref:Uncharacterized protein n=1 Tax=marine sediment metagenome TaxID=412755 RepID=A0A0F9KGN2_9ZZZZ
MRWVIIVFIVSVMACLFLGGALWQRESRSTPEIEYIEVEKLVDRLVIEVREVIVEREVVIEREVIVEREVVVERIIGLREFTSLEELEAWLDNDTTNALHMVFSSTEGLTTDPEYDDCDDYAYALQKEAEKDGYRLSVQVDVVKQHALNSVFIGNNVYFIEPQTDEVWLEAYRDEVLR